MTHVLIISELYNFGEISQGFVLPVNCTVIAIGTLLKKKEKYIKDCIYQKLDKTLFIFNYGKFLRTHSTFFFIILK